MELNAGWHWIQGVSFVLIKMVAIDAQFLLDAVLTRVSVNRIFPSHRYTEQYNREADFCNNTTAL